MQDCLQRFLFTYQNKHRMHGHIMDYGMLMYMEASQWLSAQLSWGFIHSQYPKLSYRTVCRDISSLIRTNTGCKDIQWIYKDVQWIFNGHLVQTPPAGAGGRISFCGTAQHVSSHYVICKNYFNSCLPSRYDWVLRGLCSRPSIYIDDFIDIK